MSDVIHPMSIAAPARRVGKSLDYNVVYTNGPLKPAVRPTECLAANSGQWGPWAYLIDTRLDTL